jgi:hypothetical protein
MENCPKFAELSTPLQFSFFVANDPYTTAMTMNSNNAHSEGTPRGESDGGSSSVSGAPQQISPFRRSAPFAGPAITIENSMQHEQLPSSTVTHIPSDFAPLRPNHPPTSPSTTTMKAIWFLGGNHVVKLLTSVEGDFDDDMLAKVAAVSQDVGELALSVESLVSDDFTVGGFEEELLAKIAQNTIAAKRASFTTQASVSQTSSPHVHGSSSPTVQVYPVALPVDQSAVPNPLASYDPIPNPLARITPPASPVHTTPYMGEEAVKRKEASSSIEMPLNKKIKAMRTTTMVTIQAL